MLTKKQIIEKLHENKCFIDENTLHECIKSWKIDAIYEDENKEEYFDDLDLDKIIRGMDLKSKGHNDNRILVELEQEPLQAPVAAPELPEETALEGTELKKITLDITNHTVAFLADSIAKKITCDITDHLKETDFLNSAMEIGSLKRDNELLSKHIDTLVRDNKSLLKQIEDLKVANSKYKAVLGNVYIKLD